MAPTTITPAQQLLEKMSLQQQQQQQSSNDVNTRTSPLILFQYSQNLTLRDTAAQSTSSTNTSARSPVSRVQQQQQRQQAKGQEEADLYRRAQLRPPEENAKRCLWGGPLWIQYLTQELMSSSSNSNLLWIATTTRPTPDWISASSRVKVIDTLTTSLLDSFWEQDNTESSHENHAEEHPLQTLLNQIKQHFSAHDENTKQQQNNFCIPIVLESLVPLVQLYGFSTTLQFVKQLLQCSPSLLFLPALMETLSPRQHQQLEDLAHTVMWLSNHTGQGDLHVLRKGIREHDSTVREIWNFALRPLENSTTATNMPFQLIVGEQEEEKEDDADENAPEQVNLLEEIFPERELKPQQQPVEEEPAAPVGTKSSSKKITLKLEDDNEKKGPKQMQQPQQASKNAPKIFLQDDDPEFEDFDEEDPDDDLEI